MNKDEMKCEKRVWVKNVATEPQRFSDDEHLCRSKGPTDPIPSNFLVVWTQ